MKRALRVRLLGAAAAVAVALVGIGMPSTSGAFQATISNTSNSVASVARLTCGQAFAAPRFQRNAYFEYQLSSTSAPVQDSGSDGNNGLLQVGGAFPAGVVDGSTACPNDSGSFYAPDGSTNWIQTSNSVGSSPANFTLVVWFRSSVQGGYLIGLNSSQTRTDNTENNYDRHLYLDTAGRVVFGVYSGGIRTLHTESNFADGKWHQAIAVLSSTFGMSLFLDGAKAAANTAWTTAEANTGWWRLGEGTLVDWPGAPSNTYFSGGLRFAAAYKFAFTNDDVVAFWADGRPGS